MKQVIFDKENPKGRIVEVDAPQTEENAATVTPEERMDALEAAFMEFVEVVLNGQILRIANQNG